MSQKMNVMEASVLKISIGKINCARDIPFGLYFISVRIFSSMNKIVLIPIFAPSLSVRSLPVYHVIKSRLDREAGRLKEREKN